MDHLDPVTEKALFRFQVISAYLAADPARGKRGQTLQELAAKTWMLASGEMITVKAETIRYWLRLYRTRGFEALKDKPRSDIGVRAIPKELIDQACKLKLQVPERSIERIIAIMENLQIAPPGLVRRSTLHRALKARGLSKRKLVVADQKDLDRFQADYANDLWQADMLKGPWLPDPHRPGKMRRCHLYAFLDDASRLLLYGRFSFKGDLPALELVFKRAIEIYGKPRKVYYDNGMVFRSGHMRLVCAELGIHRPIFTRPYRPMGHGKIEAFNRFCTNNFIAEVKASSILTLDQLNEAFKAWIHEEYNHHKHSELAMTPSRRWHKDASRVEYVDEEKIRIVFLWRQLRTADKTGVIRLFNRPYKVIPSLAKKRVEVRYDLEHLDQIEIYLDGSFKQRAKPLQISANRAPKEPIPVEKNLKQEKMPDYLQWLTQKHKEKIKIAPQKKEGEKSRQAFMALLQEHIHPDVFNPRLAATFFHSFGPFDAARVKQMLIDLLAAHPPNLHMSFYLNHIHQQLFGGK